MIEGLKPYPKSKRLSIPWLTSIPAHWEVRRTKTLFQEIDRRSSTGREPLLSLRMHAGLVDHHTSGGKLIPPSALIGYRRVLPGELVMNRMRAAMGLFAAATSDGLVSPDYAVFRRAGNVELPYAVHLFRTPMMASVFRMESRGLGTGEAGFLRLYSDRFGMLPMPLPPPDEQAAIVRFLDHANRRIDRFIRVKRKLIALLNEQKQAIIHRAVTRGLDPNVPMKDSGVSWLPRIPSTWTISRLKFETTHIVDCLHATPKYVEDGEYPAIRTADVEPGRLRLSQARRISQEQYELWTARLAPREGDILYSREGERYGMATSVPPGVLLCISQRMMVFRVRETTDADYIMWQLNCPHVYAQASVDVIGSTSPHVNVEQIRNFQLALAPLSEQRQISVHVRAECSRIEVVIARIEREISLIREYRTRLLADVVTGQLDVREAAAKLPAEEPALPEVAETAADEEDDTADGEAA